MLLRHGLLTDTVRDALRLAGSRGASTEELVPIMRLVLPPENAIRMYRESLVRQQRRRDQRDHRPLPCLDAQVTLGIKQMIRRTMGAQDFRREIDVLPGPRYRLKPIERTGRHVCTRHADDVDGRHVHDRS